jgi:hypothetical protein
MRKHFGAPEDKRHWYCGWYDSIGLLLATGKSWREIREVFSDDPEIIKIATWLEEHFDVESWYER